MVDAEWVGFRSGVAAGGAVRVLGDDLVAELLPLGAVAALRGVAAFPVAFPLPALGSLKLAAVDVDELERYVAHKKRAGLQPRTINRHLNVLSALFKTAVRRRLLPTNRSR